MLNLLVSTFKNIKISGIATAVPLKKENIREKYSDVFGEKAVKSFIKMVGVESRYTSSEK